VTDETTQERVTCKATTPEGAPCRQTTSVSPETGLCIWHDEARREEANAARERGREKRRRPEARTVTPDVAPATPRTLEDAVTYAAWAVTAVTTGVIDARTAREISTLLTTFRMGLEKRDLLRQITELRAKLTEYEKRGGQ
jgi:hypothetical protein